MKIVVLNPADEDFSTQQGTRKIPPTLIPEPEDDMKVMQEELPFGGVGPSGMGAYHGIQGFKNFSHAKSIYRQASMNVGKLSGMLAPYGKATERIIGMQLKK